MSDPKQHSEPQPCIHTHLRLSEFHDEGSALYECVTCGAVDPPNSPEKVSRESALVLVEDAHRWAKAYAIQRDRVADLEEQLEATRRENVLLREAMADYLDAENGYARGSHDDPQLIEQALTRLRNIAASPAGES